MVDWPWDLLRSTLLMLAGRTSHGLLGSFSEVDFFFWVFPRTFENSCNHGETFTSGRNKHAVNTAYPLDGLESEPADICWYFWWGFFMFQTSVVMQQDYSLHILPALSMLDHHDGGNNPNAAILFPQNLPHASVN